MKLDRRELLTLSAGVIACRTARANPAEEHAKAGMVEDRTVVLAGGYRIWTRRLGRGPCKVLLLHGGPGLSHDYMSCVGMVLSAAGYEVYLYDQLGCGRSDRPRDDRLWTLPRYLQEVEAVRVGLGLDRFILFGHSWGAILAIEYALQHGSSLRALVLSNMSASYSDYAAHVRRLRSELPAGVRSRLSLLEAVNHTDGVEYQRLMTRYLYNRHICRLLPWPTDVRRSLAGINTDIYNIMQGPNEFLPTGNLKNWNRWNDLHRIETPTLVMGARYDEMDPKSLCREADLVSGADLFISRSGSHLAMWDDRAAYFSALLVFLAKYRA